MRGFRDIHAHFVYGVDDGAQTFENMTAMLDAAHRDGITALYGTSHQTPGMEPFARERYERHLQEAREYCEAQGYALELYPGAELLYTPAIVRHAEEHELPTMGDSDGVLLEFVPSTPFSEIRSAVKLMERCGYIPILAHIERYENLYHGNALRLHDECNVRFQVNCATVLGSHGFFRDREIRKWFREEIVEYIGSDTHNCTSRPTRMRKAYAALAEAYGKAYAARLTGLRRD